jgi:hypothetical protein
VYSDKAKLNIGTNGTEIVIMVTMTSTTLLSALFHLAQLSSYSLLHVCWRSRSIYRERQSSTPRNKLRKREIKVVAWVLLRLEVAYG